MFDAFISYAHEDKSIAESLLSVLQALKLNVWFDELQLEIGDSVSERLQKGINQSNFGIILLSNHYLHKQWITTELKLFFQLQLSDKTKKILPIWHNVDIELIREKFPFLLDIKALSTSKSNLEQIAKEIYKVVKGKYPPSSENPEGMPTAIFALPRKNTASLDKQTQENETQQERKSLRKADFKKTLRRTVD